MSFTEAAGAKPSTGQKPQLDSYAIVIDCISVLTEGVPENMSILRDWGCIDWLMEMIQHVVTRAAALRLILQTIKLDTSLENSHGYVKEKSRENKCKYLLLF